MLPILTRGKVKRKNIFSGVGRVVETERNPTDADDSTFFHYFDPSLPARIEVVGNEIRTIYTAKDGVLSPTYSFVSNAGTALLNTGLINGLLAAETAHPLEKRWGIHPTIIPAGEFMYPSMTWFMVYRPTNSINISGYLLSDYGDVGEKVVFVKIGNGAALEVFATMRDAGSNAVGAVSGATVLSLGTDYLIVCKLDGVNKRVDLWIDGAGSAFNDFNAAYDPTTTWEGKYIPSAIPEVAVLSTVSNPLSGNIGTLFLTKTALSNVDINLYANWIATNRSGTVWNDI